MTQPDPRPFWDIDPTGRFRPVAVDYVTDEAFLLHEIRDLLKEILAKMGNR